MDRKPVDHLLLGFGIFLVVVSGLAMRAGEFAMARHSRMHATPVDGAGAGLVALIGVGIGVYCVLRAIKR